MKIKLRTLDWLLGAMLASMAFGVVILAVELQGSLTTAARASASADGTGAANEDDDSSAPLDTLEEPGDGADANPVTPSSRLSQPENLAVLQHFFPYHQLQLKIENISLHFPVVLASTPSRKLPRFIDVNQDRISFAADNAVAANPLNGNLFTAPPPSAVFPAELFPGVASGDSGSSSGGSTSPPEPGTTTTTTFPPSSTTTTTTTTTIPNHTQSGAGL